MRFGGVIIFVALDNGVGNGGLGGSGVPFLPLALMLKEASERDACLTNDVVRVSEESNEPAGGRGSCSSSGRVTAPSVSTPGVTAPDFWSDLMLDVSEPVSGSV